jgi:hypothetical protein
MSLLRAAPVNDLLAKLLFLILPTAVAGYFLLWNVNEYFSILQQGAGITGPYLFHNEAQKQALYLLLGMAGSAFFYSFRFRFLPPAIILGALLYSIYKGLDASAFGEFDAFFASVQFLTFAVLFSAGWLVGWGFLRFRFWSIIIASLVLVGCILVISKQQLDTVPRLLNRFVPSLAYALYLVFASEQIWIYRNKDRHFWTFLGKRLVAFLLVAGAVVGGTLWVLKDEIKGTVAQYGGQGKKGTTSMLKENKDGTFDLKDYSRLQSSLSRSNELLFAAHIDNFFPGTEVPNPLYLTAFYYTKFDTSTETFERDSLIPSNDLFLPDPSAIPLFRTRTDERVLLPEKGSRYQKEVEIEVYSRKLSPTTYLAPHAGYFVQPITVEKDFREEFKTAFRAKSIVSELNSAYFVYNAGDNKEINKFQQERFQILRTVNNFSGLDRRFYAYYTYMPRDPKWSRIGDLAKQVTANAKTPVDKVLAIRDYFLSKDSAGNPLYKYTDNPGIPDLPSASKLLYFLFENRQGYCAYYAGATLFMLRSLGIPSRIAAGFLTMDRSGGKNKGWYWYYADQAHAWVQVYFPGYGWLDFDTTVGNAEARESPKPDGTPPMQPPKGILAAEGITTKVDTARKLLSMRVTGFVYHDKEYKLPAAQKDLIMDVRIAAIRRDSVEVPLNTVRVGDSATAVSYAEALKQLPPRSGEIATAVMSRWPAPVPTDEVYLRRKVEAPRKDLATARTTTKAGNSRVWLWIGAGAFALTGLIYLLLPTIIFSRLRGKAKRSESGEQKAYWSFRAAHFYLHQLGVSRGDGTPLKWARQQIDPTYGTRLEAFTSLYLKVKFAGQKLTATEASMVESFLPQFLQQVQSKVPGKQRLQAFLRPVRAIRFFTGKEQAA